MATPSNQPVVPPAPIHAVREWWLRWAVPLCLVIWPFVYFWRATIGQLVLAPSDALIYSFPLRYLAAQFVREGYLPLWNPYVFSGFPLFGQMQTALLYPGSWLFLVCPPWLAINLQMTATYSIAALGTYAYCRAVGCTQCAAFFAGMTFAFSGFMQAHLPHAGSIQGAAFLPWAVYCLERWRQRGQVRFVLAGALVFLMPICTGHPPIPMYVLMVAGAYAAYVTVFERPPIGRWRYAGGAGVAMAGGVLLGAVQLLPMAELIGQSVRSGLSWETFTSFSLPLAQVPMLLFPYLFGGTWDALYWGEWSLHELVGYVGILPLMLAGTALASLLSASRLVRFWMCVAVLGFVLALGGGTPLGWLMYHVPAYNAFRAPARNVLELDLALAILSALVLSQRPLARRAVWSGVGMVIGAVATVLLTTQTAGVQVWEAQAARAVPGGFASDALRDALAWHNPALWLPATFTVAAAVALLALVRRPHPVALGAVLVVQLADLFVFATAVPKQLPRAAALFQEPKHIRTLRDIEPDRTAFRVIRTTAGAMKGVRCDYGLWGVAMANGYDPGILSRYAAFAGPMDYSGTVSERGLTKSPLFLDLLNAKYLLVSFAEPASPRLQFEGVGFAPTATSFVLRPGASIDLPIPNARVSDRVGLISFLNHSTGIVQGQQVARMTLTAANGGQVYVRILAGVHTAEWSWDAPEVREIVRHQRAPVVGGVPGQYGSVFEMDGLRRFVRIRVEYVAQRGMLTVSALSFHDSTRRLSYPLTRLHLLLEGNDRWEHIGGDAEVEIIRNRKSLPPAWLVPRTLRLSPDEILESVGTGKLPDGAPFDPRAVALVEDDDAEQVEPMDPAATVRTVSFTPNVVELESTSDTPAFLVHSASFYPGWKVYVDGAERRLVRTNYVLRGVPLPAGTHHIRFVYGPRSVKVGALVSLTALVVLLSGSMLVGMRSRRQALRIEPT